MPRADLILTNARVLTMDPENPRAEALALAGERILAVGGAAEIAALAGPGTRIIDAGGATLLPGFFEGHVHVGLGGADLTHLHIGHLHGAEAVGAAFRAFAAANPDAALLMAQEAHYGILGHPASRHDLDAMIADRPIAMMSPDLHTVWANTAALRAAGLLHGANMPHGHEVVMGADGLATGELREFEAFGPLIAFAGEGRINLGIATGEEPDPAPTPAERAADKALLLKGMEHCAAHGVTSLVNMDGNRYTLELLAEMRAEGRLALRVKVPFHFKPHMELEALERASRMAADFDDDWISSGFVKLFMDGVIDSRTAYLLRDYPDQPGHRGQPLFADFDRIATEIDRRGAGGDRRLSGGARRQRPPRQPPPHRAYRTDRPRRRAPVGRLGHHRQPATAACAGSDGFPAATDPVADRRGPLAGCLPVPQPGRGRRRHRLFQRLAGGRCLGPARHRGGADARAL